MADATRTVRTKLNTMKYTHNANTILYRPASSASRVRNMSVMSEKVAEFAMCGKKETRQTPYSGEVLPKKKPQGLRSVKSATIAPKTMDATKILTKSCAVRRTLSQAHQALTQTKRNNCATAWKSPCAS